MLPNTQMKPGCQALAIAHLPSQNSRFVKGKEVSRSLRKDYYDDLSLSPRRSWNCLPHVSTCVSPKVDKSKVYGMPTTAKIHTKRDDQPHDFHAPQSAVELFQTMGASRSRVTGYIIPTASIPGLRRPAAPVANICHMMWPTSMNSPP